MIIFTILGVLVFWWVMGCIGYFGAIAYDVHRGITKWTKPADDAMAEVMAMVYAFTYRSQDQ